MSSSIESPTLDAALHGVVVSIESARRKKVRESLPVLLIEPRVLALLCSWAGNQDRVSRTLEAAREWQAEGAGGPTLLEHVMAFAMGAGADEPVKLAAGIFHCINGPGNARR